MYYMFLCLVTDVFSLAGNGDGGGPFGTILKTIRGPFEDPLFKTYVFFNPKLFSLKCYILTSYPLYEKHHTGPYFDLKITKTCFRISKQTQCFFTSIYEY